MTQLNTTIHYLSMVLKKVQDSNILNDYDKEFVQNFIDDSTSGKRQYIVWTAMDVLAYGADKGIKITTPQAIEILAEIVAQHNPELGITWDTLDIFINDYFMDK